MKLIQWLGSSYLATLEDRVLVIHAFQKKTQATSKKDIELAVQRLKRWKKEL
jgi:phage-related protein